MSQKSDGNEPAMRRKPPKPEPTRCSCAHTADTPTWHGKRRSGAGMTGRGGANHLDPKCPHSELRHTTKRAAPKLTVKRLRLQ